MQLDFSCHLFNLVPLQPGLWASFPRSFECCIKPSSLTDALWEAVACARRSIRSRSKRCSWKKSSIFSFYFASTSQTWASVFCSSSDQDLRPQLEERVLHVCSTTESVMDELRLLQVEMRTICYWSSGVPFTAALKNQKSLFLYIFLCRNNLRKVLIWIWTFLKIQTTFLSNKQKSLDLKLRCDTSPKEDKQNWGNILGEKYFRWEWFSSH